MDFINKDTRKDTHMIDDDSLKELKQGDIIQLQRKGFYRVDRPYQPMSSHPGWTYQRRPQKRCHECERNQAKCKGKVGREKSNG